MSDAADNAAPGRQTKRGHEIDLKALSAADLRTLIADAEAELRSKQESAKGELRAKWQAEAEAAGLSLAAILAGQGERQESKRPRKDGGSKLPVKFRGPNGEAWSGRGRLPKWVQVAEAEGKKREDFKV